MGSLTKIVEEIFGKVNRKNFAEAALATGETIEAESFEAGNPVFLRTSEGDLIPLPEGEYELSDGSRIMVDAEGMIAEFSPSGSGEEEMKQESTEAAEMSEEKETEEKVAFATEETVDAKLEEFRAEIMGAFALLAEKVNGSGEKEEVKMSEQAQKEIDALKKKLHKPEILGEEKEEKSAFKLQERKVERKFVNPTIARVRENLAKFNSKQA